MQQNLAHVQGIRDNSNLRAQYEQLLSEMPDITHEHYNDVDLNELDSPSAWTLVKLLERHRGEVVHVSHRENDWKLVAGRCPWPRIKYQQQLLCEDPTTPGSCFSRWENSMNFQKLEYYEWLRPKWSEQTFLCVAPCQGSYKHHWRRRTLCSTLGDMFKALGKDYTAAMIYNFYKSRKIVVRKVATAARRKSHR